MRIIDWSADECSVDLWGKRLNQLLFKLWGGYKTELPVVEIAGDYKEGKKLADFGTEMENLRAAGLGGCKFKVGGLSPDEDAERVKVARSAMGDDFILTVDANQGYTQRDAIKFGNLIRECNIRCFEDRKRVV